MKMHQKVEKIIQNHKGFKAALVAKIAHYLHVANGLDMVWAEHIALGAIEKQPK